MTRSRERSGARAPGLKDLIATQFGVPVPVAETHLPVQRALTPIGSLLDALGGSASEHGHLAEVVVHARP